jgi:hypothetical protein
MLPSNKNSTVFSLYVTTVTVTGYMAMNSTADLRVRTETDQCIIKKFFTEYTK